MMCRVGC